MKLTLIVAASENNVIGKDNQLPWHLPRDLAYFKRITVGSPVIMGRKTYDSIGFALPQRLNIVITRNADFTLPDAVVVHSLDEAIKCAKERQPDAQEVHIIGGASIFAEALPQVDVLYLNRVLADLDGDTFLPTVDWGEWSLQTQEHHEADEKNCYSLSFEVYHRRG